MLIVRRSKLYYTTSGIITPIGGRPVPRLREDRVECMHSIQSSLNLCICCTMCVLLFFTLDAGLLALSQYSEGPATGHLDTGFSWFPGVYKQMLRWFPRFQVASHVALAT